MHQRLAASNSREPCGLAAGRPSNARWDVDGSLLLPTMQDGTWRLLRLTPAGQLVAAVPGDFPSKVDPYVTDLHLSVRP